MPRGARKEGYSRRHRFTTQGSFGPILKGSRKLRGRYAVLHVAAARDGHSRLGLALTRRLVPAATDRNLFKRVVREAFRRHVVKQSGLECVITLRQKFLAADLPAMAAEIASFFDQLNRNGAR
jgi:ribonuclease P protein component